MVSEGGFLFYFYYFLGGHAVGTALVVVEHVTTIASVLASATARQRQAALSSRNTELKRL
jgi:hypothetical protein